MSKPAFWYTKMASVTGYRFSTHKRDDDAHQRPLYDQKTVDDLNSTITWQGRTLIDLLSEFNAANEEFNATKEKNKWLEEQKGQLQDFLYEVEVESAKARKEADVNALAYRDCKDDFDKLFRISEKQKLDIDNLQENAHQIIFMLNNANNENLKLKHEISHYSAAVDKFVAERKALIDERNKWA